MSNDALASRLRDYLRTRGDELRHPVLKDLLQDWTTYKVAVGRLDELDGLSEQITTIMRDINSVGSG
jgi:hypothetical protein